jgi:23S rRNA (cytosine1962-C5)-methyltransferase
LSVPSIVRLARPLERVLYAGHPWVYRDALLPHDVSPGELVDVADKKGKVIARGIAESGPIAVRVLSTRPKERVDVSFLRARLADAFSMRQSALPTDTTAYRLAHGEGDRVPGFVCDRYGDYAVLKLDGAAAEAWSARWVEAVEPLLREIGVKGALLRRSRKQGASTELAFGEAPPTEVEVREHGMKLLANLHEGQKTGLFLDHRESRARVRSLSRQRSVLNLYGYTGGFSVAAGLGAATQVTTVDLAKPAIALAERTWLHNDLSADLHVATASDVPAWLREASEAKRRFELIVADPPNFAPQQAVLEQALESYRALHAACLGMVAAGGLYLAASCSSHIRVADFLDTLREGARRARKVVSILEQTGAPFDHPRLLAFPEGDYLKVVLLRVM